MDPRITLGVLCDQLRLPEDTMDHEDAIHLRKLVINFLTGEAKKGSLQRIITPGSESEQFLIENLTKVRVMSPSGFLLQNNVVFDRQYTS